MDGYVVLKSEVNLAMAKINKNKSAVTDGIVSEMQSAFDNFRIDEITEIIKYKTTVKYMKVCIVVPSWQF